MVVVRGRRRKTRFYTWPPRVRSPFFCLLCRSGHGIDYWKYSSRHCWFNVSDISQLTCLNSFSRRLYDVFHLSWCFKGNSILAWKFWNRSFAIVGSVAKLQETVWSISTPDIFAIWSYWLAKLIIFDHMIKLSFYSIVFECSILIDVHLLGPFYFYGGG